MKFKILAFVFLLASVGAFAQKSEIRQAERALENHKISKTKHLLEEAAPNLSSLNDKWKTRFYMAKGDFYLAMMNQYASIDGLKTVQNCFENVIKYGNKSDKKEAQEKLQAATDIMVNSGVSDMKKGNYKTAYQKLHLAYKITPQDTVYLYYAASNAYYAKKDSVAIPYYKKLKDLGYQGNHLQYTAKEKATGKVESFGKDKTKRDLFVKSGKYTDPGVRRAESKYGDVIKKLALLYLRNDQQKKALGAIQEAKKVNPNDLQVIKAEAYVYEKMGKSDKVEDLIRELIRKDPDNAGKYYKMIGDNLVKENPQEAKRYYKKAVEANPKMAEAYNRIASIILQKDQKIVKEMNSLGMSTADTKRYNKLAKKRKAILKEAIPYMKKTLKYDPDNVNAARTLYQLEVQMGNQDEAKKYKKMIHNMAAQEKQGADQDQD